ncbi:UV DNA damage repair endonuclease UvsE [Fibrella sp. HMF5335]|uniref:UV DNA damage repair endonuclease UvsE n=1 Tax=Fibrella rubiginis TaxID=2817060 RepID=A0A939GD03_9BACT|nr:UV DNA damage repair endonuclease UvsE [Fibrella rubiginis]MBO0936837.1 UV DNA damage repair endonuclease UvsE [Fibrella rubiginis]
MLTTTPNAGYACINLTLQVDEKITTTRGMIKKTFTEKGVQYASQLALQNVQDLLKVVDWNLAHGFRLFRITSDLFPWASEYRMAELPDFFEIRAILEDIGARPIRLTCHPGPFNHLAGQGKTLENTVKDLEYQSEVFDMMGLLPSHWNKINIHAGGTYGDKTATLARFAHNFQTRLSESLRARLTVENDDRPNLYTVQDLLYLHEQIGTPIVFDYFHHSLNPGEQTEEEAFMTAYATWDVRPVFHFSNSRREYEDPKARKEAHADWLYTPANTYGKDVDIVFESKMKELSILRLRGEEPDYSPKMIKLIEAAALAADVAGTTD